MEFLRDFRSADVWPTTWAWEKRCRSWPCWKPAVFCERNSFRISRKLKRRCPDNGNSTGAKRKMGPSSSSFPRSLIFNWQEEAESSRRNLRVLDHTGIGRAKSAEAFDRFDLILTTYGTLRNDALFLKDCSFDYRHSRRGAGDQERLQRIGQGRPPAAGRSSPGAFRHAGQNHLGELWSLFEFLNPGMLGTARAFQADRRKTRGRARRPANCSPAPCGRSSSAAPSSRWPRTCRNGSSRRSTASSTPNSESSTTSCKEHYRNSLLTRIAKEGIEQGQDPDPRSPAPAAPGGVPSGPDRQDRKPTRQRQARLAAGAAARGDGREPQGAGLLAVHQLPVHRPQPTGQGEGRLRIPRRPHPRPPDAGRALPERSN